MEVQQAGKRRQRDSGRRPKASPPALAIEAGGEEQATRATPITRRSAAAVQVSLADALEIKCPQCNAVAQFHTLDLVLSLGPLPEGMQLFLVGPDDGLDDVLDKVRKGLISRALKKARGNLSKAATLLDVKYSTFYTMVRRLDLGAEEKTEETKDDDASALV